MARVAIDNPAFTDLRFAIFAQRLGREHDSYAHYTGLGLMAHVWNYCTERNKNVLLGHELALLFKVPAERAVDALTFAELGEQVSDGIYIKGTEGRIEWLAELRRTSRAGGKVRARKAKRSADGTFLPRDLEKEITAALAQAGHGLKRSELQQELQCKRQTLLQAVNHMLQSQELVEQDGRLFLPDSMPLMTRASAAREQVEHSATPNTPTLLTPTEPPETPETEATTASVVHGCFGQTRHGSPPPAVQEPKRGINIWWGDEAAQSAGTIGPVVGATGTDIEHQGDSVPGNPAASSALTAALTLTPTVTITAAAATTVGEPKPAEPEPAAALAAHPCFMKAASVDASGAVAGAARPGVEHQGDPQQPAAASAAHNCFVRAASAQGSTRASAGAKAAMEHPDGSVDRYSYWYKRWRDMCRKACGDKFVDPGEIAGRDRVCRALMNAELAGRSAEQLEHGFRMLWAECDERARLHRAKPWQLLIACWKRPEILSYAIETPTEASARARASARTRPAGTMPALQEPKRGINIWKG